MVCKWFSSTRYRKRYGLSDSSPTLQNLFLREASRTTILIFKSYLNFSISPVDADLSIGNPAFGSNCLGELLLFTVFQKMFQSFDELMRRGSNWTLKKVNSMKIHSASYKAIGGKAHFPLPRALAVSKAVINV